MIDPNCQNFQLSHTTCSAIDDDDDTFFKVLNGDHSGNTNVNEHWRPYGSQTVNFSLQF